MKQRSLKKKCHNDPESDPPNPVFWGCQGSIGTTQWEKGPALMAAPPEGSNTDVRDGPLSLSVDAAQTQPCGDWETETYLLILIEHQHHWSQEISEGGVVLLVIERGQCRGGGALNDSSWDSDIRRWWQ